MSMICGLHNACRCLMGCNHKPVMGCMCLTRQCQLPLMPPAFRADSHGVNRPEPVRPLYVGPLASGADGPAVAPATSVWAVECLTPGQVLQGHATNEGLQVLR